MAVPSSDSSEFVTYTSCIVAELSYNNHKYAEAENACVDNGYICVCGYPSANHPDECFEYIYC